MMTTSKRVLAAVSAIGLTATLASCELGGRLGLEELRNVGANTDVGIGAEVGAVRGRWQRRSRCCH